MIVEIIPHGIKSRAFYMIQQYIFASCKSGDTEPIRSDTYSTGREIKLPIEALPYLPMYSG